MIERYIRPLFDERKSSLFFGSHKMARVSTAYHTLISTCRLVGISVLDYFKRVFTELSHSNKDDTGLLSEAIAGV